jgi:hypothetical protein
MTTQDWGLITINRFVSESTAMRLHTARAVLLLTNRTVLATRS